MNGNSITPNLVIPGFPKSGTSSLYHYLCHHDEINGVEGKEPHIFTSKKRFEQRAEILSDRFDASRSYSYYLDASTTYMISPGAPHRIHEVAPDCKLIVIARDPIERVFSHYNWLWCNGFVEKDFKTEVREWTGRKFDPTVSIGGNYKYYIEFSAYGEQMIRYLSEFYCSQILFLTTEALKNDPQQVLNQCFDFLGLQAPSTVDTRRRNVTRAKEIIRTPSLLSRARRIVPNHLMNALPTQLVTSTVKSWLTETREPKSFGESEEALVFEFLEDDIRKQQELGIFSDRWSTTAKYS
jgi:hypothetical protein